MASEFKLDYSFTTRVRGTASTLEDALKVGGLKSITIGDVQTGRKGGKWAPVDIVISKEEGAKPIVSCDMHFNIFVHPEGASPSTCRLVSNKNYIGIDPRDKDIFKVEYDSRDGQHIVKYQVEDKPFNETLQKDLNERILRKDGATEMIEGVEPKYVVQKTAWYSVIHEVINKMLIDRKDVDPELYEAEKQRRIKGEPRTQTSNGNTPTAPKDNQRVATRVKTSDAVNIPSRKDAEKGKGAGGKQAKF